ncbi:MAG TPA: hypothetical protein PKA05_14385 [Roseiflexaceae bacterium]|nr:hypothetical protein [Roseiflexaceae bacterium]
MARQLLAERDDSTADGGTQRILLQGWGLFDNQLEEDLDNVELTLVAGMPVSFRYQLYEPHTPERPLIRDETRTVAAPVEFGAMETARAKRAARPPAAPAPMAAAMSMSLRESASDMSIDRLEASTGGTSVGEERGALFQYRVAHPISVARGQSAMVPIVATRLAGRKDLLYNPRKYAGHPVASLRLTNTTGLTLERGPTTVIEDGDYAGEAVLPFTTTGAELIIPYAVELGITIIEQTHHERQMASIRVRDSYLLVEEWEISRTTYQIYNALDRAAEVVIEQHLPADWDLNETPEPREQAQGLARWPVACAPQHETSFPIQLRRRIYRREEVRNTPPERLQEYLNNKYLDQQTFNALSQVLGLYAEIARRQQRLKMIEQERQQIYKHQQQTQGSLAPLGRDGDEGALRARYVALLGKLEDQLATLAAEEQQIQQQIAQIEQAAAKALARL